MSEEGMFSRSNVVITGGKFNQSVARTQASISFDKLAGKASPRAFHLADSDPSHATCYGNTRSKTLEHLKGWVLRSIEKDKFVMWLHGAAGGGKTAIARTIAKWCDKEEGILLGEYFFSRGDGTGDQLVSLVPTLAYRMAVHTLADAKGVIADAISQDPHIFLATLHDQFKKLVLDPYDLISPCGITPYVIILDGLDETLSSDDQQLVLDAITETLYQHNSTLRILVCSRPEPTIVTAFKDPDSLLFSISSQISLNDDADSDADIRSFLVEKFIKIRKQLPYPPNGDWPTSDNIDYLVSKSSGQFIFASTVEKYVGSSNHRHHAVARLKHVLDLDLLPKLEDKRKHPFAALDALYSLILKTRNDVEVSVKAIAVCLEYPRYLDKVSPADLANVLGAEIGETWAILYELASLLDSSEEQIRPFHASFGDFLYDQTRSLDLHCNRSDIVTDIACAIFREDRNPEVLSYKIMSQLLADANPRNTLGEILMQIAPDSIFGRSSGKRPKGGYYLVSLLRHVQSHLPSATHEDFVTYFDENFAMLLPYGRWKPSIFRMKKVEVRNKPDTVKKAIKSKEGEDSSDSMVALQSVSDTEDDEEDWDSSDDSNSEEFERAQSTHAKGLELVNHYVPDLVPLVVFPAWDKEKDQLSIRLRGPDTLCGLCDEGHFSRTHLPKTMAKVLNRPIQTKAALFCLKEIKSTGTQDGARVAFSNLLVHSLSHAGQSSQLTNSIENLLTVYPSICKSLPSTTMQAITQYLDLIPSGASKKPSAPPGNVPRPAQTSSRAVPGHKASGTPMNPSGTSSTPSVTGRTPHKPTSTSPGSSTNPKSQPRSQPQPVQRSFLTPPSARPATSPSPNNTQKGSGPSRTPIKLAGAGSNNSKTASSQSSAATQPNPPIPTKPSRTSGPPASNESPPSSYQNPETIRSNNASQIETQSQSLNSPKPNNARKKKGKGK